MVEEVSPIVERSLGIRRLVRMTLPFRPALFVFTNELIQSIVEPIVKTTYLTQEGRFLFAINSIFNLASGQVLLLALIWNLLFENIWLFRSVAELLLKWWLILKIASLDYAGNNGVVSIY
jgi:hypothetical protein